MENRNFPPGLSSAEARARAAAGRVNRTAVRTHPYSRILLDNTFSLFNLVIGFIVAFLLFYWWRTGNADLAWDTVGVSAVALLNTAIAIAHYGIDAVNKHPAARNAALICAHVPSVLHHEVLGGGIW